MTLLLHTAPGTAVLADRLADLLAQPPDDPFAVDLVVVSARGTERWLAQRLSHRLGVGSRGGDGVCAGVRFISPGSLVGLLLGRDRDDPWHPDRLVWPVLATIDASLGEPWCADLARHLGHGLPEQEAALRRSRRYSVARRLAGLFASYAAQRPTLITDWREGRDTDGAGGALADDLRWQAQLWRRTLPRVGVEPPDVRHAATVERLRGPRAEADALDLPDRLSLFGHTRLTGGDVDLLAALGEHRDVHLWLPQASPRLWQRLHGEGGVDGADGVGGVVPRADDDSVDLVAHPLLASLGRDTRELARTLHGVAPAPDPELSVEQEQAPTTLLGWLQHDLRANALPDHQTRAARVPARDDRSVQVHACHGPARQVQVLREVLVGLLADDPTLEPRDILVLCPDIEAYSPLISAGFGLGDAGSVGVEALSAADVHPAHRLRVRLADRSPTATNPLLGVAARLVEMAGSRVTASEVLDLAAGPSVRRRFALTDDDLARIAHWAGAAGVRWGLDRDSRADFAMQGFAHNTWRSGLDRILLGVAMSGDDDRALGVGLPLDDVGSGEVELAGRLSAYVERLGGVLRALRSAGPPEEWVEALIDAIRLLTSVDEADGWQRPHLERELRQSTREAHGSEGEVLRQADVRALLANRLAGRPTRANFRTGTLTVCTMTPMRSVPHRVVALLGLDDGGFPRVDHLDGDDVLARRSLTGERDTRSEDRQLLLDAVLAAGDTLVLTYTGANEHTGASRPPAVPLGEVLDALDRTATPGDGAAGAAVRDQVLTRHPLQAHDHRNLVAGALVPGRVFTFDRAALAGAQAQAGPRERPGVLLEAPLPARSHAGEVTLGDLKAFLAHPARTFLRERLDVATSISGDEVDDRIPVDLDALEKWEVGDRVVRAGLDGRDMVAMLHAEQLRGTLPPGELGLRVLEQILGQAQGLLDAAAGLRGGEPAQVEIDLPIGDGVRLTGSVGRVFGDRVVSIGYSRLKPRQRLETWVDVLALTAAHPDGGWSGHVMGKGGRRPAYAQIGPLRDHADDAADRLRALVALRSEGLERPVPAPVATACAWAEMRAREVAGRSVPKSPAEAAAGEWVTDPFHQLGIEGEDRDPANRRVWGIDAPLSVLLDAGLAEAAWTIWEPLVASERRSTL